MIIKCLVPYKMTNEIMNLRHTLRTSMFFLATLGLTLASVVTPSPIQAQSFEIGCVQNNEIQTFVASDKARTNIKLVNRQICNNRLILDYRLQVNRSNIDSLIADLDLKGFGGNQINIVNTQNQSVEFVGIASNGARIKETLKASQIARNKVLLKYRIKVGQGVDPTKLATLVNKIYPLEVFATDNQTSVIEGALEATNSSQTNFNIQTNQIGITNVTQKVTAMIPRATEEYKLTFNSALARIVNTSTTCNKSSTVLLDLQAIEQSQNNLQVASSKDCLFNIQDVVVLK
jgi:spore coat protein CotH